MVKTLFKRASNGKVQKWSVEYDGNMFRTSEGYVGGAISVTAWTICEGKSIGRSNETSGSDQAIKETEAKIEKQKKRGYAEDVNDIDTSARKHLPMLAHNFEDHIEKIMMSGCILAVQPKLDGIRMIDTVEGPFSKEGNVHNPAAWVLHNHSLVILEGIESCKLDGELYNHEYKANFNKIASIVRTKKPTAEALELAKEKLQYHLYDINLIGQSSKASFTERYAALRTLLSMHPHPQFKLVETVFINTLGRTRVSIDKQLYDLHKRFVNEGYEGSMIRNASSPYKQSRTSDLLKRKDWIDEEFRIVDIHEGKGNRSGMAASVTCVDSKGEQFDVGIIGDEKYCTILLQQKSYAIGNMATIKYQNLTPDRKVPRFGKMKSIRDYE
jgi:DNA ligase-1